MWIFRSSDPFAALALFARCFSRLPQKHLKSRACLGILFSPAPAHPLLGSPTSPGSCFPQVLSPPTAAPSEIVFPGALRPGRPNHTLNHSCDKGPGDSPRVLLLPQGPYLAHLQGKQLCQPTRAPCGSAPDILPCGGAGSGLWDRLESAVGSSLCGVTRSVPGCWSPVSHGGWWLL